MDGHCDICGKWGIVYVRCSSLCAMSLAYCTDCLLSYREPYGVLVASLVGTGATSLEGVAEHLHPVVHASLEGAGKTLEDLFRDLDEAETEYVEHGGR